MVFVKFPEPGKVKTRLAKSLGNEGAVDVYKRLVARVAEQVVPPQGGGDGWSIWIVFDPADQGPAVDAWLQPLFGEAVGAYLPQVVGDLGARLGSAFATGFGAGFEKVAAIGTDCVDLTADGIRACWEALEESDVVFGPAEDGGYYLIGLKANSPDLFAEIPWSSERTLQASKEAAAAAGLSIAELAVLTDVDEIGAWQALRASDPRWASRKQ
jgi:rSAM/selenodomain-associated transferase 1